MCLESEALKEINELKSEIAKYRNRLGVVQTIKRSNIALLNDIEQTFTNGTGTDFIDVFAAYKAKLELDK